MKSSKVLSPDASEIPESKAMKVVAMAVAVASAALAARAATEIEAVVERKLLLMASPEVMAAEKSRAMKAALLQREGRLGATKFLVSQLDLQLKDSRRFEMMAPVVLQ